MALMNTKQYYTGSFPAGADSNYNTDPITEKNQFTIEISQGDTPKCTECLLVWCTHLEFWLSEYADSEDIFGEHHADTESFVVTLPVFPTYNLFGSVMLWRMLEWPVPAYSVSQLNDPPGKSFGFISEGEGRVSIRSLMLAESWNTTAKLKCDSQGHGFKDEMKFQKNIIDSKMKHIERYLLRFQGACFSCTERINGLDFDDLVPDKEPTPWSVA